MSQEIGQLLMTQYMLESMLNREVEFFLPISNQTHVRVDISIGDRDILQSRLNHVGITIDNACDIVLAGVQRACTKFADDPTAQQIVDEIACFLICPCLDVIPPHLLPAIILNNLSNCIGVDLNCEDLLLVYEYFQLSGQALPSQDEFNRFIENRRQSISHPSEYCENNRHEVPTPGIENITSRVMTEKDQWCSICLCKIKCGEDVFQIPQCGHNFHANEDTCLGSGASILTWLKKSKKCPNCNVEIVL